MKVFRFIGLFALSYFLLIAAYVIATSLVAFYELAPVGDKVAILLGFVRDSSLSIFRDSTRWVVGSEGLYNFVPTLNLINGVTIFRSLSAHAVVQVATFAFVGTFAASRQCSFAMMLFLPPCLVGLTMSLLSGRLLMLAYYSYTSVAVVVGMQVVGLFIGSIFYTTRLK